VASAVGNVGSVARTLVQTGALWAIFFVGGPLAAGWLASRTALAGHSFASDLTRIFGLVLFAACGLPALVTGVQLAVRGRGAARTLDPPERLVVAGLYRHVRNPLAMLSLAQGLAVALWLGSPAALAYLLAALLLWNFVARPWEERRLSARFGAPYDLYRRRVRCWRPRLRPWDPSRESNEPPLSAERTTPPARPTVLFDGHCRFCAAQTRNLTRLMPAGAADLVSFQTEGVLDRFPGVTHAACMEAMHLVLPDGRVFAGFEAAVRAVALSLPGRVAYLYYVPGLRLLCDAAYALIAANRYRLMGKSTECTDGTCQLHLKRK